MSSSQTTAVVIPDFARSLFRPLMQPWLDRTIATIACLPLVYLTWHRYQHMHGEKLSKGVWPS